MASTVTANITAAALRAKAGTKIRDTQVRGFMAYIATDGTATFYLDYVEKATGKRRNHKIGTTAEMKVGEARSIAASLKLQRNAGEDLVAAKRTPAQRAKEDAGYTFGEVADLWLETKQADWSASTYRGYRQVLARRLPETMRCRLATDVKDTDVVRATDRARAVSKADAGLFYRTVGSMLSWGNARGYTAIHLPKLSQVAPNVAPRDRLITDEEIAAIWSAFEQLNGREDEEVDRHLAGRTTALGKIWLLTGQRTGALHELRREWIRGREIVFPAEVMKAGKEHRVPIGPMLAEVLAPYLEDVTPRALFVRSGQTQTTRLKQAWPTIKQLAGLDANTRMHDIRRSLRTWAARNRFDYLACEAAIAHTVQKSALDKAYLHHDYSDEAGELLLAWQAHVASTIISKGE